MLVEVSVQARDIDVRPDLADLAADLTKDEAAFLAASQRPTALSAFTTPLPAVAWPDKPSYGIVATRDKTLSPHLERFMYARSKATITELEASHLVHLSQPRAVAAILESAAKSSH